MGYLHSKGIIHKDLKSRNVFVDGNRVTITDAGLFGLNAVCGDNSRFVKGVLMTKNVSIDRTFMRLRKRCPKATHIY